MTPVLPQPSKVKVNYHHSKTIGKVDYSLLKNFIGKETGKSTWKFSFLVEKEIAKRKKKGTKSRERQKRKSVSREGKD